MSQRAQRKRRRNERLEERRLAELQDSHNLYTEPLMSLPADPEPEHHLDHAQLSSETLLDRIRRSHPGIRNVTGDLFTGARPASTRELEELLRARSSRKEE